MDRATFRPDPTIPAHKMTSFEIAAPVATHWRKATCAEVDCPDYRLGWTIPLSSTKPSDIDLFKAKGFRFVSVDSAQGPVLLFEAGQPCFRASIHKTRLDREELFLQRPGDWRVSLQESKSLGKPVIFSSADAFADALHTHLGKFAD